jgi:cell wall assembly regulator SMI1
MRLAFPSELRASYLLHDGSGHSVFPWGYHLLDLEEMVREWRKLRDYLAQGNYETEPEGPIRQVHWNIRWIPVASNESGDHHFVDLDPAAGGSVGQVFHHSHEVGPVRILATGFGQWLAGYADRLEVGVFEYDPYDGWVCCDDPEQW